MNKAIMTIGFSGNVPIIIMIREVHIDHSKVDRTIFSMDNNKWKVRRTIERE